MSSKYKYNDIKLKHFFCTMFYAVSHMPNMTSQYSKSNTNSTTTRSNPEEMRDLRRSAPSRDLRRESSTHPRHSAPGRDLRRTTMQTQQQQQQHEGDGPICLCVPPELLAMHFECYGLTKTGLFGGIDYLLSQYDRDLSHTIHHEGDHFKVEYYTRCENVELSLRVYAIETHESSRAFLIECECEPSSQPRMVIDLFWYLRGHLSGIRYCIPDELCRFYHENMLRRAPTVIDAPRQVSGTHWREHRNIVSLPKCAHCSNLNRTRAVPLPTNHWLRADPRPDSVVICPVLNQTICTFCHKTGHTKSRCEELKRKIEITANAVCSFCKETGHITKRCPALAEATCRYCKEKGHTIARCPAIAEKNARTQVGGGGGVVKSEPAKDTYASKLQGLSLSKPQQFDVDSFMSDEVRTPHSPDMPPPPAHFRPRSPDMPPPPPRSTTPTMPPPPISNTKNVSFCPIETSESDGAWDDDEVAAVTSTVKSSENVVLVPVVIEHEEDDEEW